VEILENKNIPKALKNSDDYVYRHMGNSTNSTNYMLKELGVESIE
jgi:glycine cleavage system pyridoxal-binding protein P